MKSHVNWPHVAVLIVGLAAILIAYAFVAPAAAAVTGAVNTIIGSMFLNLRAPLPPDHVVIPKAIAPLPKPESGDQQ